MPPARRFAARLAVATLALSTLASRAGAQARVDTIRPTRQPSDSAQAGREAGRRLGAVLVTGARSAAAVGGASAVVVRPDSLLLPPASSLDRLLRATPFVLVRQNSRGEAELSVRGSDSRQAAVLLDGLPLSLGWDDRTDPSLVPLTGVRQITLVRGLSSLLGGPNTLGGTIEVELGGAGGGASPGGRPALSLGTGVDQYGAHVFSASAGRATSAGSGTLSVRGGASYRRRDGFALPAGRLAPGQGGGADPGDAADAALRTNSDLRQTDGFAAARYERSGGAFAALTATAFQARRGVPPELHLDEPRLWRYPSVRRTVAVASAGSGTVRTPLGRGSLSASAGVNDGALEIESFADRAYTERGDGELGDERTVSARVQGTHTLPAGGELRAAFTRAGIRYDETLGDAASSRYRQRLTSVGAEAQLPLFDRAVLSGGAVYDAASTPETGGKPSLGDLSQWGWRLGASTAVAGDAVRLHGSLSRRARFPALRELYSGALGRFDPNPSLRPERLLGAEVGATVVGGGAARAGLMLQGVVFRHRLNDAVVRITTPERLFRRVNRDQLRSAGVELLAGYAPPPTDSVPGVWLRRVSVSADVLAQRVRLYDQTLAAGEGSERRAEHQPELRGALELGAPIAAGVRGSARARYTGRQFCIHPDFGERVALAARTATDAALTRRWGVAGRVLSELRAVLALDNVGDATVYDQCGLPQPGRTLRVGIELR